jgi:CubicO group peptidase (beta-lactamase class C family)
MGVFGIPGLPNGWTAASPAELGLAADIIARLDDGQAAGDYGGLHALLIARHGRLAVERYYDGADESWGHPLDSPAHGPELLHDMRSVTKSVVSLLYGIALAEGLVPATATRLFDALPDYAELASSPLHRRLTIGHVLSMRMGIAWNEDMTYADPKNGEREMEAAADRYRYVLSRPMLEAPGKRWVYCGGATALLGLLIARGSGQRLEAFAADRLFAPLGIAEWEWINGSDGQAAASSGLRLKARDMARLGQLVLDRGHAFGRRIVPPGWLAVSFKPRAAVESGLHYGYQWWIGHLLQSGKPWAAAFGNGGQRLFVIPSLGLTVAIMAGNYNKADQWKMPVRLMSRIVIPSVVSA